SAYAYVADNPIQRIDPRGLYYSWSQSGNTVTIHSSITIYGPNASNALASKWQSGINDYWNNAAATNFTYGTCRVVFDVRVSAAPCANWWFSAKAADNDIDVMSSPYRSRVWMGNFFGHAVENWYGSWEASASGWEAAHESGHLFGLFD